MQEKTFLMFLFLFLFMKIINACKRMRAKSYEGSTKFGRDKGKIRRYKQVREEQKHEIRNNATCQTRTANYFYSYE